MLILLQFCMVRNLLLTFHFWQCLGLVYTCLVLSWRSLHAKISLLCLIFHGNDFSEIHWGCKSLFHGQSHQHLSSDWLMPPCPSLFLSFPADELLPDSRNFFFSSQVHGLALCTVNRNGIKFSPALTTSISDTLFPFCVSSVALFSVLDRCLYVLFQGFQ